MNLNAASPTIPPPGAILPGLVQNLWQWVRSAVRPKKVRRLRVCETLPLGERRFLAVIEFDRQEFLVAGTGTSLTLLARVEGGQLASGPMLPGEAKGL